MERSKQQYVPDLQGTSPSIVLRGDVLPQQRVNPPSIDLPGVSSVHQGQFPPSIVLRGDVLPHQGVNPPCIDLPGATSINHGPFPPRIVLHGERSTPPLLSQESQLHRPPQQGLYTVPNMASPTPIAPSRRFLVNRSTAEDNVENELCMFCLSLY